MHDGRRRLAVAVSAIALVGASAAPALAKGSGGGGGGTTSAGTITINPTSSVAGSAMNYVLRYQAKGGFSNQIVSFGFPNEFTAPAIGGSGPGNIAVLKGTCSTNNSAPYLVSYNGQWWVQFGNVSCPKGGNYLQIGYNKVAVPTHAAPYTFPGYGPAGSPAAPAVETVTAGPAVSIGFSQSSGDVYAGSPLSPDAGVQVVDQFGNPESGSVTLSLRTYPADTLGAFASGTTTVALNSGGWAYFPGMVVDTAGVYKLRATYGSLSTDSPAFTVNPAGPASLAFVHTIADAAAGDVLGVQVAIMDAYGNVETNDNASVVNAAIKSPNVPGGTLSGFSSGPTVVNGVATFPNLSIDRQGVYTLTASSGSLSQDSNAFTINADVSKPSNGAGNWISGYGFTEWWLFEYGVDPSGDPYNPPNLQVGSAGAGATLGDLTGSGASGWSYSADTADDRALANPCAGNSGCAAATGLATTANRASGALYSATDMSTVLQFGSAYSGKLTIYAVDWEPSGRDETITVHDGLGDQTAQLQGFGGGAYVTFNITTGAASNVTISVHNNAGPNAVISGIFLN